MKNLLRTLLIITVVFFIVVVLAHHMDLGATFRKFHGG